MDLVLCPGTEHRGKGTRRRWVRRTGQGEWGKRSGQEEEGCFAEWTARDAQDVMAWRKMGRKKGDWTGEGLGGDAIGWQKDGSGVGVYASNETPLPKGGRKARWDLGARVEIWACRKIIEN